MIARLIAFAFVVLAALAAAACSTSEQREHAVHQGLSLARGVCRVCNSACRLVPGTPQSGGDSSGGVAPSQKHGAPTSDPRPKVRPARFIGWVPTWRR
mgnify:CR=1 FL=1